MPSFTVFKGSKDGSIKKSETTKPELKGDQVLVKITASGLCGTDVHYRNGKPDRFARRQSSARSFVFSGDIVLGHEGVGVVEATGPETKFLKKGDRGM